MEVIIRDSRGSCPHCKGLLRPVIREKLFRCVDCNTYYAAETAGYDKNGVIMEERKRA